MGKREDRQRRLILEAGSHVILHPDGPAGGFPRSTLVDHVKDGLHWFLGNCDPLARGESLIVEYPIPGDARYVTHATIQADANEIFALKINALWERAQQREFVRISAHGLSARVVRARWTEPFEDGNAADEAEDASSTRLYPLLDISAGGIRFQSKTDFEADEEVVCHFELPGADCFVLPARIIRGQDGPLEHVAKPEVAVEFVGLSEDHRTQLLRWVYREQVKRRRNEKNARGE